MNEDVLISSQELIEMIESFLSEHPPVRLNADELTDNEREIFYRSVTSYGFIRHLLNKLKNY